MLLSHDVSSLTEEKRFILDKFDVLDLHLTCNKMCVLTISFEEISQDYISAISPNKIDLSYGEDQ